MANDRGTYSVRFQDPATKRTWSETIVNPNFAALQADQTKLFLFATRLDASYQCAQQSRP